MKLQITLRTVELEPGLVRAESAQRVMAMHGGELHLTDKRLHGLVTALVFGLPRG